MHQKLEVIVISDKKEDLYFDIGENGLDDDIEYGRSLEMAIKKARIMKKKMKGPSSRGKMMARRASPRLDGGGGGEIDGASHINDLEKEMASMSLSSLKKNSSSENMNYALLLRSPRVW